jgi:hypothetical protein
MVFFRSSSIKNFRRPTTRETLDWTPTSTVNGQRGQDETVTSRVKREYRSFVRSRHWWKQFCELVVGCLLHDINKTP